MYSNNFDKIVHLMPLYNPDRDGARENVIPVFENSIQLSGYIAQSIDKIYSKEYDYYAIMSSECLLNPSINSNNLEETFEINQDTCFIADNISAVTSDTYNDTNWAFPSAFNLTYGRNGAEIRRFIPEKVQARKLFFDKAGVHTPHIYVDYLDYLQRRLVVNKRQNHPFFFRLKYGNLNIRDLTKAFETKLEQDKRATVYPFVASCSEFFIIPNNAIKEFAHYCGLLAAGRLHYNAAFATAMCFSAKRIKMLKDLKTNIKILNLEENDAGCPHNIELRRCDDGNILLLDDNEEQILMAYPISLSMCGFGS